MDLNLLVNKNQSIKVVPSTEDTMIVSGLNLHLDENTKIWFQQLERTWQIWNKIEAVENHVISFFHSVEDPYRVTLIYIIRNNEVKDCKPKTLQYFLIETLQKWGQTHQETIPNDQVKYAAFEVGILQRNQLFLQLILKTYGVVSIKKKILPIIKEMMFNDNCKQASQIVVALDLSDDVSVGDLLFPIILQDKIVLMDEYLSACINQVKPLLTFLDQLFDQKVSLLQYVQKYIEEHKVTQVNYEKVQRKALEKLATRLCRKFNIPVETCKNLYKNKTARGLRYLLKKKYLGNNISPSEWDDLVKDSLQKCAECAEEFIDLLVDYDKQEALKWSNFMGISADNLPLALKDLSINGDVSNEAENWDTEMNPTCYYKLKLPENKVEIIDTADKLNNIIDLISNKYSLVGIDCEWKPSFGTTQSQVALIQLAVDNFAYLIDTIVLNKEQYSSVWHKFNKSLLSNAEIIKLGFGLEQDLREMKVSIIGLNNINVKGEGLLDLSLLWASLTESGFISLQDKESLGKSLSSIVQYCFGLPLQKAEQCSNWELRPLRKTQIEYAALDAYILIELYNYLYKFCNEQDIAFEEICNDIMLEAKKKTPSKKQSKFKVVDQIKISLSSEPSVSFQLARNMKFLVEPNLSHLMSYLRYCGIDTCVVSSTMPWHEIVNLAISENRLILVLKPKCTPTSKYPQKSILNVGRGSIKLQLRTVIDTYHVKVEESHILCRCLICNQPGLKKLTPQEVKTLCKEYQYPSSSDLEKKIPYKFNQYEDYEEDVYADNFMDDSDCDEDLYQPVSSAYTNNIKCKTSKGATVDIQNVQKLSISQKSADLCESCGKLYWDEDELQRSVSQVVFSVISSRV